MIDEKYTRLDSCNSYTDEQALSFCSYTLLNGDDVNSVDDVIRNKNNQALGKTRVRRYCYEDAFSYTSYLFMDDDFIYIIEHLDNGVPELNTPWTIQALPVALLPKDHPETWYTLAKQDGVTITMNPDDNGEYTTSPDCVPSIDDVHVQCDCFSVLTDGE